MTLNRPETAVELDLSDRPLTTHYSRSFMELTADFSPSGVQQYRGPMTHLTS